MKKIIIAVVLLTPCLLWAQTRYYVRAGAAGGGNSWSDAAGDLQEVLQTAVSGDEVWVAEGVYYPTAGTDRRISFAPAGGVKLLGGFEGTETEANQRDWEAHVTVLSGDIGVPGDSTDNTLNVLFYQEPDSSTVLEGFVVSDGNADLWSEAVNGSLDRKVCGGGIFITAGDTDAYIRVRHCTFRHNTAGSHGGGMMSTGNQVWSSMGPLLEHCRFENNRAVMWGGGVYRVGGSAVEQGADIAGCYFSHNRATTGGGLYWVDSNGLDTAEVKNCRFEENVATVWGGGAYFFPARPGYTVFSLDSCVFQGNYGRTILDIFPNGMEYEGEMKISNSIFTGNALTGNAKGVVRTDMLATEDSRVALEGCRWVNNAGGSNSVLSFGYGKIIFRNNYLEDNAPLVQFGDNGEIVFDHVKAKFLAPVAPANSFHGLVIATAKNGRVEMSNSVFYIDSLLPDFIFSTLPNITELYATNITLTGKGAFILWANYNDMLSVHIHNSIFDTPNMTWSDDSQLKSYLSDCYVSDFDCSAPPAHVSCSGPVYSGVDPMFAAPEAWDFRLQACSPLVNKGNNDWVPGGTTDLSGAPRIQGGGVDLGAYEAAPVSLSGTPVVTGSCAGGAGGSVAVSAQNACPPLSYYWSGPGGSTGSDLSGLAPGSYLLTVSDMKNDTATVAFSIPSVTVAPAVATTPVWCGDTEGGTATVELPGATAYLWSDGGSDPVRVQLGAGAYGVTVTDAGGCTGSAVAQVGTQGSLHAAIEGAGPQCYGDSTGMLTVQPLDGLGPYSWEWSNGHTQPAATGLAAGQYWGRVTDALGCMVNWIYPLEQPDSIAVAALTVAASGPAVSDGSIGLLISGGTAGYEVMWSNGGTGLQQEEIATGHYTVTVTDGAGCTRVVTIVLDWVSAAGEPAAAAQVWPNPSDGTLFTRWNTPDDGIFTLFQVNGVAAFGPLPLPPSLNTFHLQHLPAGTYLWSIQTPQHTFRGRWVRQ